MPAFTMTRRALLQLCGAVPFAFVLERPMRAEQQKLATAAAGIDHLLLGVGDLDDGIAWVENRTGVRAVAGGRHQGVGTRNALLSLGDHTYLEIIAPDPEQDVYLFPIEVRELREPRLITWAAGTDDIEGVGDRARRAGFEVSGPSAGSRTKPDGAVLRWRTLAITNTFGGEGVEPFPFFIEWAGGSPHPAQDSPAGCRLESFMIEHPAAARLGRSFEELGISTAATQADRARLVAILRTPNGAVELS